MERSATITLPDGRKATITGSEEKIQDFISSLPDVNSQLPEDVRKNGFDINGRQDLLGQALGEMQTRKPMDYIDPRKGLGVAGTNLKAIGGVYQRGEAALSNPIIAMQKNLINGLDPRTQFSEFLSGASGNKLGEYGDIARNAGVPEPVAAGLGLATSMALDPIAGLSSKPAKAFGEYLNQATQRGGARVMDSVLNTPVKYLIKGKDLGREALEYGITGSYRKMLNKISDDLVKTDGAIESFLAGRSEVINAKNITSALDKIYDTRTLAGDIAGAKMVKKVQETINGLADPTGNIKIDVAQKFKQALNKLVGEEGFFSKKPAAITEARKIASGATASEIEKATRGLVEPRTGKTVAEINKEVGSKLNIAKAIKKQFADRSNNPLFSMLDVVSSVNPTLFAANIGRRAMATSSIGSGVANAMYQGGKKGYSGILGRIALSSLAEGSRKATGLKTRGMQK